MQYAGDGHCIILPVPYHFVSFFPFEYGVPKPPKKCCKFICEQLAEVSKIYCFKEVWYKDWTMSLYKPRQVRACFYWIIEKSQIIQLKISFQDDNFRVDYFQRSKFCHIWLDYFLREFLELLELKSRFQQPAWKKLFYKNSYQIETGQLISIAYKTRI